MSQSRGRMAVEIEDILAERTCLTMEEGDSPGTLVNKALSHMALIAREVAQASWKLRQPEQDRDDLMKADEDELVRQAMAIPWWLIYPELPFQIEGVLRDSFDDEHFRLEDPTGWAEVNEDLPVRVLH